MRYEITGCFENAEGIATLAEFVMRWIERMQRAAESRDWGLYRSDVLAIAGRYDLEIGSFEAFPDCRFGELPEVVFKEATIRVRLRADREEDVDAIEDALLAIGAESVEVEEQIDPTAF